VTSFAVAAGKVQLRLIPKIRKIRKNKKTNKMKKINMISKSLILGLFVVLSTSVHAQDPPKLTPNVKILLDNDKVKLIEAEFAPGAATDWHSHPNHILYALTDGKMEVTDKDKPAIVMEIKAGSAMYLQAVTHKIKNIGTATMKILVTELKPAP
jgi:quercetin dioxygenase-like cupin family protein